MKDKKISFEDEIFKEIRKPDWFKDKKGYSHYDVLKAIKLTRQKERNRIIEHEINMQCLMCGENLKYEIMNKMIHVHLCNSCRDIVLSKLNSKVKE